MAGVDELLHSDAPLVVIEAAGGCGKTWTAARFAREMSGRLPGRRILLLSHTHAACGEFHRRCEQRGLRIDIETCDSFALRLVAPYAAAVGLPVPLESQLGRAGGVTFAKLGEKAVELLQRAPTIARLVATAYPIIILDEHQDASIAQHNMVMTLMRAGGARLRIFGDPMQALHPPGDGACVDWGALWSLGPDRIELTIPRRWPDAPQLGDWITAARRTLQLGGGVRLQDAPPEVHLVRTDGLAGRNKFRKPERAGELVRAFLKTGSGPAAILAHLREMVHALAQAASWQARVNEGAALEHLDTLLAKVEDPWRSPVTVAAAFLDFARQVGTGLPKPLREGITRRIGPSLDLRQAGSKQQPWLEAIAAIYSDDSHRGIAEAMSRLLRLRPKGYRVRLRDHAMSLRALGEADDPRGQVHAHSRVRRRRVLPEEVVSTIHKAKGLEFDRVLVCPADSQQFPSGGYGARLLYVAMSRATRSLTLVVDTESPPVHLDLSP